MSNQFSIRTFNEEGLNEMERVIGEIRNNNIKEIPAELLTDGHYSEIHEPIINIERVDFRNKNELIPYLVNQLNLKTNKHLYFDKGLWSWLTAFYFNNICPADGNGKRKVNEAAFYVLKDPKNFETDPNWMALVEAKSALTAVQNQLSAFKPDALTQAAQRDATARKILQHMPAKELKYVEARAKEALKVTSPK